MDINVLDILGKTQKKKKEDILCHSEGFIPGLNIIDKVMGLWNHQGWKRFQDHLVQLSTCHQYNPTKPCPLSANCDISCFKDIDLHTRHLQ